MQAPVCGQIIVNRMLLGKDEKVVPFEKANGFIRCMYTMEPIQGVPIGIPVAKDTVNTDDNCTSVYYCVDVFDTFNDALAELQRRRHNRAHTKLYEKSEIYLREIFAAYYPDDQLLPSLDNRLLKVFNGPLSISEFRDRAYQIHSVQPSLILAPAVQLLNYVEND